MEINIVELALLLLLAIFVGALIPALLEVRRAAKAIRKQVTSSGAIADDTLIAVQEVTQRVNGLLVGVKGGDEELAKLMVALGHTADAMERFNHMVHVSSAVGSAVGPAAAAFVTALRQRPASVDELGNGQHRDHA